MSRGSLAGFSFGFAIVQGFLAQIVSGLALRRAEIIGNAGLEYLVGAAYSLSMNEIRPPRRRRAETPPDLAPPGTPPHVAVAPGLLDHEHVVIRADDDTDEDYEAKQLLLDAALAFARKG
jgi:hypothetical protein